MRKIIVMMVLLLAASMMTQANAPDMHAFYNPATLARAKAGQLSETEQRDAFRALFSHTNEARWWNTIPTCSFDQMRYIYALHLKDVFGAPQVPSDEEMLALVNRSQLVPAPPSVNTAGIVKGTATVKRFTRPAYPNEKMFVDNGIAWASGGCGNLGANIFDQFDLLPIKEEFDRGTPDPRVQFACNGCPGGNVQQNNNNSLDPNVLALIAAMQQRPEPVRNDGDDWMKQYMQMQMMKEMSQQAQPVVETRQRANFWEVAAGVTGLVNVGLNAWDLAQGAKTNRLLQSQMYRQNQTTTYMPTTVWNGGQDQTWRPPTNRWPQPDRGQNRPRQPDRVWPDYDRGTWYENPRPSQGWDTQGASGDYRLGAVGSYQNANSGLGIGQGFGSNYGYNDPYYNRRNNPLQDNGEGNAWDRRTGREYTYDTNYVF